MKASPINTLDQQSQKPRGSRFFEPDDILNIVGGEYEDNILWYVLDNGIKVKSFDVTLDLYSDLSDADKSQLYICYRKLRDGNRPIDDEVSEVPDTLYFNHIPADPLRVSNWSPQIFANVAAESAAKTGRKHVFIYMHGFDWQPGLKLDLAAKFVQSYFNHPENSVAKVLYFGWPSFGGRKDADDRSVDYGQRFTQNGLFNYFRLLSEALQKQGQTLNLIVHSFGHQLLNGMINPGDGNRHQLPKGIFENIFLMAPDITHLAIQKNGVTLRNPGKTRKGRHYYYNLAPLKELGKRVHIYYNSADYLLYVSSKQSYGVDNATFDSTPDPMGITTDYRNLGNYGKEAFDAPGSTLVLEPGFEFVNVQKLFATSEGKPCNLSYFPFRNNTNAALADAKNGNYKDIHFLQGLFNGDLLLPHHQYLFTCGAVVDDVLQRLKNNPDAAPQNASPDILA